MTFFLIGVFLAMAPGEMRARRHGLKSKTDYLSRVHDPYAMMIINLPYNKKNAALVFMQQVRNVPLR